MTVFWAMYIIPLIALFNPRSLRPNQTWLPWLGVTVLFAVWMGFRHEVGGDWGSYERHFNRISLLSFDAVLEYGDPGYYVLNWLVAKLGGSLYWVNFVCASVLMVGTVKFCRSQPQPWLALAVAVPYMLVVVGMGYTRQSVALGFALLALTALGNSRLRWFIIWIAIGATFHKSAVLLLPIAALASSRNRFMTAGMVGVVTVLLYYLLLADSSEALWTNYVVADYESEGGAIRVAMNALPALIFLVWGRRLTPNPAEHKLWLWMSLLALVCVPLVFISSTAVDRVALYLIPVQMYVFSRLPSLAKGRKDSSLLVMAVALFYGLVEFVWLNYANHAYYWLPYKFMPFD